MRSGTQFLGNGPPPRMGQIEYRLARDSIVREFRRGRLSRLDVCDGQSELMRVAKHLGRPVEDACPICEEQSLVHVWFAFGPGLPASGRALETATETAKICRRGTEVVCYVVEVCNGCRWNHLVRSFEAAAGTRRGAAGRR